MDQANLSILSNQHHDLVKDLLNLSPERKNWKPPSSDPDLYLAAVRLVAERVMRHFDLEEELLYQPLADHPDDMVRWTMEDFARDLKFIRTALGTFIAQPEMDSPNRSLERAETLCRKLIHRLSLEEEVLFPMLNKRSEGVKTSGVR